MKNGYRNPIGFRRWVVHEGESTRTLQEKLIGLTNTMQRANINIQRGATDRRSARFTHYKNNRNLGRGRLFFSAMVIFPDKVE